MGEAEDEPLFAERAAGVDIAKAGIEVTVRVPSQTRRGGRRQDTRSFRTTGKDLRALADRLRVWGVARIGMEPAGDYRSRCCPCPGVSGLGCVLYHAAQDWALPGRPETGKPGLGVAGEDHRAGRAAGLLRAPGGDPPAAHPHPVPAAPDPGPHRREEPGGESCRVDAHLKLSSVISASTGSPAGRCRGLSPPGSVTPGTLARLARDSMRGKIARLAEAPGCSFVTEEHAAVLTIWRPRTRSWPIRTPARWP